MNLSIPMRHFVAIVALLALTLAMPRSACEVLAPLLPASASVSLPDHDPAAGSPAGHGRHVVSHKAGVSAIPAAANGMPLVAVAVAAAFAVPVVSFATRSAVHRVAPAPPRSYYARSARILR